VITPRTHGAQRDHQDHLPLRRAERHRGLAQAVRDEAQHVLGGAHDDGNHDQRQRERARPRREVPDAKHVDLIDEEPMMIDGAGQQDVVDEARHRRKPAAAAEFSEVDAGEDSHRRADRVPMNAIMTLPAIALARPRAAGRRRCLREQVGAERMEPGREQREQDPEQESEPNTIVMSDITRLKRLMSTRRA
jgi:hypothetical protein